jgi:hypothetical protein
MSVTTGAPPESPLKHGFYRADFPACPGAAYNAFGGKQCVPPNPNHPVISRSRKQVSAHV